MNHDSTKKTRTMHKAAFYVILFLLYFISRFVFLAKLVPPIGLEECHTGAAAVEIIHHGFQFPIEQYTPEYYETTIIITSLITTIPVRIWGLVPFSVELVPFLFSFGVLALCCALLIKGGFSRGIGFFAVCFFFCSGTFVYLTMDSVGSHIIALFLCMLILYFFYSYCVSGRTASFYLFSFFAGLGAFVYMSTLMYSALCVSVLILHVRIDREFAARLGVKKEQVLWGIRLFFIGYIPNFYFLSKTEFKNLSFLKNIFHRRVENPSEQIAFFKSHLNSFLFQFDHRPWIPVLFFALFVVGGYYLLKLRKQPERFDTYLLLVTIYIGIIPFLLFIALLSGREFTSYYIYLMPLLFLMGSAVLALAMQSLSGKYGNLSVVIHLCVLVPLCLAFVNHFRPAWNFSVRDSHRIYVQDKESAYCYWRFGQAFSNYTEYSPDPAVYAMRIREKCDRFDTEPKRNACYMGWLSNSELLGSRSIAVLGDKRGRLLALGIGRWGQTLESCNSIGPDSFHYFDDCIAGLIVRKLMVIHSTSPGIQAAQMVYFPCMPDLPRVSGLRSKLRDGLRQGTIDSEAVKCVDKLHDVQSIMVGYCSAIESGESHCRKICGTDDDISVCEFVYEVTRQAKEWEKMRSQSLNP